MSNNIPYSEQRNVVFSRCSHNGKSGWRHVGGMEHCFTGPNGKAQCIKHCVSVHGQKKFSEMMNNS